MRNPGYFERIVIEKDFWNIDPEGLLIFSDFWNWPLVSHIKNGTIKMEKILNKQSEYSLRRRFL